MNITPEQFRAVAPDASDATAHALFDGGLGSHFATSCLHAGIVAPASVVQFLAVCHSLSDGFTNFSAESPDSWLNVRACDWLAWKLTPDALGWDYDVILSMFFRHAGREIHYPQVWQTLQSVCDALGVANQTEANQ